MRQKIIIDTDPGQDDAVALLMALASPDELEILAITCVAGNVGLPLTTRNARALRELANRPDVPIHAGCAAPLARPLVTAEEVHGQTGLDGIPLPEPVLPLETQHAVDAIIEIVMREEPGTVTLCPLGPLTNIAEALTRAPQIAARLKRIVLMGGAFSEGGNITPTAEFNIYVDPEAAKIVFACGAPITVLPLDATHQALTDAKFLADLRAMGSHVGEVAASWTDWYERYDAKKYGTNGAPLHDPCVIAWVLAPELFEGREINVEVETTSPLTLGMTVADWWGVTGRAANALFIRKLDRDGVFALITSRIARLRDAS